ncbi:MAG: YjgP/YjgQ family permease [Flavobacteriaceae bacterium]|jgi:lipopolysaccharide export system permease protein|nr:YjgP/YjgQ family permease [Flavobacteriaceae bacterium]MBT5493233.1 YjgP/YjgQ family permease [Flavobacteriaceae bacterium]MBT7573754.1 YjgP/YjgQ family permease [Flavobacteriaceae bacterium]MDC3182335.1 LptF/LptG family permease [Flavobacteriaceae bacterium]
MKIIDRYILTSYLKIFFSFFFILMFIFIIQIIWVFIDDLAGKEVDFEIIFKFLLFYSPKLLPLVIPLTVLLASIMTFGNLSEQYELAAIKSSGISLFRSMRSLLVVNIILCIGMFFIANSLIPYAEFKSYNLRKNLAKLKPALAITEGVFSDINNMNIKVERKYGPDNNLLEDIIIHQNNFNSRNTLVIKAESGELRSQDSSEILQLVLNNGKRYEEIESRSPNNKQVSPHTLVSFEKHVMNIDLREFNKVDFDDEKFSNTYRMQNISQLNFSIDSLSKNLVFRYNNFAKNFYARTGISNFGRNVRTDNSFKDSVLYTNYNSHLKDFPRNKQLDVLNESLNLTNSHVQVLLNQKDNFFIKEKIVNLHKSNLYDKYALGFASLILFFVGAPLGAIIRKGGIGLPMVVSLILFLSYHFIGTFSRNAAEDGSIDALIGSIIPNAIMLPLGLYLIYRASSDKSIFNFDKISYPFRLFLKKISSIKFRLKK